MSAEEMTAQILLIEDDIELRELLIFELVEEGYEVSQAVDGPEAALKLAQKEFDLVISDMMITRWGGEDLLADFKKAFPKTPAIFIVAFGEGPFYPEVSQAESLHFICKPFKMRELKEIVRKTLQTANNV